MNQDATLKDNCWQCDKPLSAVPDTPQPINKGAVQQATLEERVARRKAERLAGRNRRLMQQALAAILVLLAVALVLFLLHNARR